MSAELKAEDRDWNLDRVERFLQERNAEVVGEGLSEFDDETYQLARDLKKSKKSRILPILTSVAALAVFGAVVWYAYNWNEGQLSPGALPVIAAKDGPIKERPTEEGGLEIPYRDRAVLNEGLDEEAAEAVEHLLPPPDEPIAQEAPAVMLTATAGDAGADEASADEAGDAATADAPEAVAPAQSAPEPSSQAAATTASAPGDGAAAPAKTAAPATAETASPAKSTAEAPQGAKVAQVPTDGGYFLQIASVQDRTNVDAEWKRLQKMFPALLGDMTLQIEEAQVGGKTFFRLKTGPFPTRTTAEDVCAQLKSKKQACLLKKQG
jgi:cell division septation protein DedD